MIEEPIQPSGTDFTAMLSHARCGPRRDAEARRRAGSGRAGEAAGAGCLTKPEVYQRVKRSQGIERAAPRPCCAGGSLQYPRCASDSQNPPRRNMMAWTTPTLVEICIGLEINGYLPAEF